MPETPIVLCADDYGLAPGVSRGILALIEAGRLSATSAMTIGPYWPADAARLAALAGNHPGTVQVGLHLTLTDQNPLGPMPLLAPSGRLPSIAQLVIGGMTGRLAGPAIAAEIAAEAGRQLDAFIAAFGRPPDFIDGHQHAHVLPVVRRVVLDLWRARLNGRGWVRSCHDRAAAIMGRRVDVARALIISRLGAPLGRQLRHHQVPHNHGGFRGVYDFSDAVPYAALFERFLKDARPGMLIMCHPGEVDDVLRGLDPVTGQREVELRYFGSDEHARALARAGVRVGPLA